MEGWERLWRHEDVVAAWQRPDDRIVELARGLGVRRAYDLGCGVGRHTVALAERGVAVVGSDVSATALARCRAVLASRVLGAGLVVSRMTSVPFGDGRFDLVVAYHVLYHGTSDQIAAALAEVRRVLRPGGHAYFTLISANDSKRGRLARQAAAGEAEQVEPNTFRRPDEAESDDYLPHHFTTETELRDRFLASFEPLEVEERRFEVRDPHEAVRRRAHWHVLARRP